jgi:multiple sugar transport system permease protein
MVNKEIIKIRKKMFRILIYVLAVIIFIYTMAPVVWLFIASISTKAELFTIPYRWIPKEPTFERYVELILGSSANISSPTFQFGQAFLNSLQIAGLVTILSLIVGIMAVYAFSRFRFRGKYMARMSILSVQMIPAVVLVIPLHIIISRIGMMDNKLTLVVVYLTFILPFVVLIMRGYIDSIPIELEEAARIDGCSRLGAFFKVLLPLSSSGLTATTVFIFILSWNEFFYAMNFTTTIAAKTVPIVLTEFASKNAIEFGLMSTASIITLLPPVLLAIIFQRYIITGLTGGAVKG